MFCHARNCEVDVTGKTPTGWVMGRKPGAKGRAGIIVTGDLLDDIKEATKDKTRVAHLADKYGVSGATIQNLMVKMGLLQRKRRHTDRNRILERIARNLRALDDQATVALENRVRDALKKDTLDKGLVKDIRTYVNKQRVK